MHRVTFVITGLSRGGAETQLSRVAPRLRSRGWQPQVVSLIEPTAFTEQLRAAGIEVISLGMSRGVPHPGALVRLWRVVQDRKPQVLVNFMFHADVLGRVAGRLAGVPVIVSAIRNENFGGPLRDRVLKWTNGLADAITINSERAADGVAARGVVCRRNVQVIPNGLVIGDYQCTPEAGWQVRHDLGVQEDEFLWLAVGRLEPQKDYETMLNAFAQLRDPWRLFIAGEGRQRQKLEGKARELGISDSVRFLGRRTDIPALLGAADGFVSSSAWEGLPNVVMEAFASGTAVVATNVGGVPELVHEGTSGFMVPPKDPSALAEAMRALMEMPAHKREEMGTNGQTYIHDQYGLDKVVSLWEELFLKLLESS